MAKGGWETAWRSLDDLVVRKRLEQHWGAFSEIAVMYACGPRASCSR